MVKLEYISELDFSSEQVEFSDEHYSIAEKLHKQYKSKDFSKCSPIMVKDDKKSLVFLVNLGDKKNRFAYERGDNAYKVIIEKLR